ncbi:hypothetical protein chiPu_0013644 [Chiloscyllium punctatum]|uniref:Uncharacterized protein n=1 Tax=Chiloscyllium punctatum TaxID=137246 RepID=A0A401SXM1_CHIPU|nr:hypothetical protein [Chiloscyllium punctatum]
MELIAGGVRSVRLSPHVGSDSGSPRVRSNPVWRRSHSRFLGRSGSELAPAPNNRVNFNPARPTVWCRSGAECPSSRSRGRLPTVNDRSEEDI